MRLSVHRTPPGGSGPQRSAHLIRLWLLLVTVPVITRAVLVPHLGPCCERLWADTIFPDGQGQLGANHRLTTLGSRPQGCGLCPRLGTCRMCLSPQAGNAPRGTAHAFFSL